MRLTSFLCKFIPEWHGSIPKFSGHDLIGKRRYVPAVRQGDRMRMLWELAETEKMLNVLSKPYISKEQESAYLQSVGRSQPEYYDDFMWQKTREPVGHRFAYHFLISAEKQSVFEDED